MLEAVEGTFDDVAAAVGVLVVADRATTAGAAAMAMGFLVIGFGDHAADPAGAQVARIAREMVVRWGMSPKVGPLNYTDGDTGAFQQRPYSEATAQLIDEEVRRIAGECQGDAEKLLGEHRPQLDALTRALLEHDSLDEAQILEVTGIKPQVAQQVATAGGLVAAAPTKATNRT